MRIGSLFSGIGGLELGLERAGLGSVAWQVEREPYCRHILAKHWPDALRFDDVRTVGAHNLSPVDVLCGGFPCQDLSAANTSGRGLDGDRSGLWFEMRRIIHELRPSWVVVENVAHTWRRYVPVVRRAFWELGYASLPLRVRACDVGARHERARILLVAGRDHADVDRIGREARRLDESRGRVGPSRSGAAIGGADGADGDDADASRLGLRARSAEHWSERPGRAEPARIAAPDDARLGLPLGGDFDGDGGEERAAAGGGVEDGGGLVSPGFGLPPRPWMVRELHGLPSWVDGARRSGWTPARIREARIRGLGNAVVPQVAEAVGRMIVDVATARGAA